MLVLGATVKYVPLPVTLQGENRRNAERRVQQDLAVTEEVDMWPSQKTTSREETLME